MQSDLRTKTSRSNKGNHTITWCYITGRYESHCRGHKDLRSFLWGRGLRQVNRHPPGYRKVGSTMWCGVLQSFGANWADKPGSSSGFCGGATRLPVQNSHVPCLFLCIVSNLCFHTIPNVLSSFADCLAGRDSPCQTNGLLGWRLVLF